MVKNIEVLKHNNIKTHSHYDYFSEEDINKVKKEKSKIVITNDLEEKTLNLGSCISTSRRYIYYE